VTRHIAIVTCDLLPDGDVEDKPLLAALTELGAEVSVLSWTAPEVDWARFDAAVIRSTWDYPARRAEFLAWADSVPRLYNPAPVIRANSDKRYLAALQEAGLPVVPTAFFDPAEQVVLPTAGEYVVKPSVGAGSRGAGRFEAGEPAIAEQALQHAAQLQQAGLTVMVQPYVTGVDSTGETALIFIDGRFSHAICKSAMLPPGSQYGLQTEELYIMETITARTPSAAELEVGNQVLAALHTDLDETLLYARIDLLPGQDGPVLVEAELTEPSLFLPYGEGAGQLLARAILNRTG
jgi:glutathione synthase/RimK-type ligase-like ATP-grasp enzyme